MNFHATTTPRIPKVDGTTTVEHRIALHYSDTGNDTRDTVTVVVDKNVEEIK